MASPRFFQRKIELARYAVRLITEGRSADAVTIIRNRRLGYDAMEWRARVSTSCRTVIDAGAHTGEVSAAIDFALRPDRILAVEANPVRAAGLRTRFAAQSHIQVAAVALADQNGTLPFYLQDFDAASSLYPLREGYLTDLGLPDGTRQIAVPARRLDEIAAESDITNVDLIKLDCQGAELRILQGAGKLLQRTRIISTEVTFEPIYDGGALFHELNSFLRSAGFDLADLSQIDAAQGSITQADALYVQRSTT